MINSNYEETNQIIKKEIDIIESQHIDIIIKNNADFSKYNINISKVNNTKKVI